MKRTALFFVFAILVCPSLHAHYSQLALGGGYECILIVTNKLTTEFVGGADLRKGNGELWDTPFEVNGQPASSHDIKFTLPPFGSKRLVLTGESTASTGYLQVYGSGANSGSDVALAFFYNFVSDGRLVDSIGVPPSYQSLGHMFAVEKSAGVNTAFAWSRWTPSAAFDISMTLYDLAGNKVQEKTIPFTGHLARFFDEVFDEVPENFVGHVRLVSPQAVHMVVLRMETSGDAFQLTSTPSTVFSPQ